MPLAPPRAGSSPHTRGAPASWSGETMRDGDHPRIRGEHAIGLYGCKTQPGSSPHTRGARYRPLRLQDSAGIIPAYAGSTSPGTGWAAPGMDHPRIRGEHTYMPEAGFPVTGSSPHTRGAQADQVFGIEESRIIPAYAGSTPETPAPPPPHWDHPRIRGEHEVVVDPIQFVGGSSPHTRGAR